MSDEELIYDIPPCDIQQAKDFFRHVPKHLNALEKYIEGTDNICSTKRQVCEVMTVDLRGLQGY